MTTLEREIEKDKLREIIEKSVTDFIELQKVNSCSSQALVNKIAPLLGENIINQIQGKNQ